MPPKQVASFTDAWIETYPDVSTIIFDESRPSRTRGLKLQMGFFVDAYLVSRPSRTRGLKHLVKQTGLAVEVASFTDAWIETWHAPVAHVFQPRRVLHGRVD